MFSHHLKGQLAQMTRDAAPRSKILLQYPNSGLGLCPLANIMLPSLCIICVCNARDGINVIGRFSHLGLGVMQPASLQIELLAHGGS